MQGWAIDANDPLIGRTLGRFQIEGRLGAGAIGVVYRARDAITGDDAAVKVLMSGLPASHNSGRRLQREAAFARKIHHPNVVQILDVGSEGDITYVGMELINGPSLEQLIALQGALHPARAARLASDIAAGLAEAHANGIVHRDLKPGNVMIAGSRPERAKLVDFGVARLLDMEGTDQLTPLTREGFTVGTPSYMAPEQFNSGKVGPEADLYALGLLLYEMLAGAPAFAGTLREVVLKQMTAPPPPLPPLGGLERWVERLTEKLPEERPKDAAEVRDALIELAHAMEGSPAPQVRRPTQPNPVYTPSSPGEAEAIARSLGPLGDDVHTPLETEPPVPEAAFASASSPELEAAAGLHPPLPWRWVGGLTAVVAMLIAVPWLTGAPELKVEPVPMPAIAAEPMPPPQPAAAHPANTIATPGAAVAPSAAAAGDPAIGPPPVKVTPSPRPKKPAADSYEAVSRALDEVSVTLKRRDPGQQHARLWDRFADLWEANRRDASPSTHARLLAEIRQLARDAEQVPPR